MKAAAFAYHRARDIADALAALRENDGAKVSAGGCSLGPMLNLRLARPAMLVDLRNVGELRRLAQGKDAIEIGACWTHAEIEDGVLPDVTQGMLQKVASGIAYRPIRNRGTIGGSLAHADPAADWISALTALDATLIMTGSGGERRSDVPNFMLGGFTTDLAEDELLSAISIPALTPGARWTYYKICRKTGEFAKAIGAVVTDRERGYARIVAGAVEATPLVLLQASRVLAERGADEAARVAGEEIDSALAHHDAAFRQLHRVAVTRALAELKA